ncbi:glycosyltransferase family 2 protein [Flaviaesturariibacter amylovorans]|uniref:Glycosyltransferase family 2 protein n=2 Tax=Flaviaesturariibacter amylovorans TaxID=1084520 RepID=A0ABP8HKK5_9BACT
MQATFSIVIVCKNEESRIGHALESVRGLSDDIVVYDSGSTDGTLALVERAGIVPHRGPWLGYGATRRAATGLARHDWVLCVDADESLSEALRRELSSLTPQPGTAYAVRLRNHLGARYIRWGAWGADRRTRLFHRGTGNWSEAPIHEKVQLAHGTHIVHLQGTIHHRTAASMADYRRKLDAYARLTAEQYHREGKEATFVRRYFSPLYTFFKNYVLKLGLLEGRAGWQISVATAGYTRKKYKWLGELERGA